MVIFTLRLIGSICWVERLSLPGTADSRSHDIEFGQLAIIFTLTTFTMISCC